MKNQKKMVKIQWSLTALKKFYESVGINSEKVANYIILVIWSNQRCYYKNLYFSLACYAWYSFKNTRKEKMWILTLWIWYFDWLKIKALANGSKCLSFFKFIISNGSKNQTFSFDRYIKFDWNLILFEKTLRIEQEKRKG